MDSSEQARRKALRDGYKQGQQEATWQALTLDRAALDGLLDHVEERVTGDGCDHSLRYSQEWAEQEGRAWEPLSAALRQAGGHCDCEVLANVDPDS